MRYTEYHCGVAVIKDRDLLSEAMAKLARYEDAEEAGMSATPGGTYWIATGYPQENLYCQTVERVDPLLDAMPHEIRKRVDAWGSPRK